MPSKYTKVQTQDDTDSSSAASHSRSSSAGGTNLTPGTMKNLPQEKNPSSTDAVAASNIPPTYSSQQLISSSQDNDSINNDLDHEIGRTRPSINNTNEVQLTFWNIPKIDIFTVVVLCFINLINYMDRFTIAG